MLVRALQVEVGRPARVGPGFDGEGVGRAGIEPDVQDVVDLLKVGRIAVGPKELGRIEREPGVRPRLAHGFDDTGVDGLVAQRLAGLAVDEHGDGRAPGPLARNQPVRTGLDHAAQPVLARGGIEASGVHRGQRALAQGAAIVQRLVHGDEPLRRVAEDHRRLGAPGVGIGVLQPAAGQQRAGLDQPVHHRRVGGAELAELLAFGLQHLEAAEQGDMIVIGPVRIDHLGDVATA